MMKNVIIILGSPKTNGNTAMVVNTMITAIDNNNINIKKVELARYKKINHCIGCDSCKKNDLHQCAFDDGLNSIVNEVRKSDLLVIACPIYFFNFNSLTKAFIDRLFYSSEISNDENLLRGKKVCLILTYGLKNAVESGANNALQSFYDISKFVGLEVVGIVEGSSGDDQDQKEMLLQKSKNLGEIINSKL